MDWEWSSNIVTALAGKSEMAGKGECIDEQARVIASAQNKGKWNRGVSIEINFCL